MLDTYAYGKGFGLHRNTACVQHLHRVAGAVSQSQQQMAAGEGVDGIPVFDSNAGQLSGINRNILQAVTEADIAAQIQQLLPHSFQRDVQIVGTDVGFGINENGFRCAAGYQLLQNPAVPQVFCTGVQLAVGKCTGAALTELHIGLGVQFAAAPEALHILCALLHTVAPFQ